MRTSRNSKPVSWEAVNKWVKQASERSSEFAPFSSISCATCASGSGMRCCCCLCCCRSCRRTRTHATLRRPLAVHAGKRAACVRQYARPFSPIPVVVPPSDLLHAESGAHDLPLFFFSLASTLMGQMNKIREARMLYFSPYKKVFGILILFGLPAV